MVLASSSPVMALVFSSLPEMVLASFSFTSLVLEVEAEVAVGAVEEERLVLF